MRRFVQDIWARLFPYFVSAFFLFSSVPGAWAERRVALVIANGAYQYAENVPTASTGADLIEGALGHQDFQITRHTNLAAAALAQAFANFIASLQSGDIALVFFAGHGVNRDGRNFLLPIDWDPQRPVKPMPVSLNELVNTVQLKSGAALFFIDTGRRVAALETLENASAGPMFRGGLVPQDIPQGVLLSFSAQRQPGATGAGMETAESLYSRVLYEELAMAPANAEGWRDLPGFSPALVAGEVELRVWVRSAAALAVWSSSTLQPEFWVMGDATKHWRAYSVAPPDDLLKDPKADELKRALQLAELEEAHAKQQIATIDRARARDPQAAFTREDRDLLEGRYQLAKQNLEAKRNEWLYAQKKGGSGAIRGKDNQSGTKNWSGDVWKSGPIDGKPDAGKTVYSDRDLYSQIFKNTGKGVDTGLSVPPAPPVGHRTAEPDRTYAAVDVYFGTDRLQGADKKIGEFTLATFANDDGRELKLGHAVVTVPATKDRKPGTITVPEEYTHWVFWTKKEQTDPSKHFVVQQSRVLTRDEFKQRAHEKISGSQQFREQAFVFVHGYRNSFEDALMRTAQMAYDIGFDGAAFLYSWPSLGIISKESYGIDRDRSRATVDNLKAFIDLILKETGAKQVHFVAHSMGNWPLLEAMETLGAPPEEDAEKQINQIVLAAPDMDQRNFEILTGKLKPHAKSITLLASSNDWALSASEYVGQHRVGSLLGDGRPVIVPDVYSIDVSDAGSCFWCLNHSTFAEGVHLLGDISEMFRRGTQPPDERSRAIFKKEPSASGIYWRYLKN